MTLTEIAKRINAHLKRFEADPVINAPRGERDSQPYFYAGAYRAGNRVGVTYISFQHTSKLTRPEAEAYLEWLDAGNVGRHHELRRESHDRH